MTYRYNPGCPCCCPCLYDYFNDVDITLLTEHAPSCGTWVRPQSPSINIVGAGDLSANTSYLILEGDMRGYVTASVSTRAFYFQLTNNSAESNNGIYYIFPFDNTEDFGYEYDSANNLTTINIRPRLSDSNYADGQISIWTGVCTYTISNNMVGSSENSIGNTSPIPNTELIIIDAESSNGFDSAQFSIQTDLWVGGLAANNEFVKAGIMGRCDISAKDGWQAILSYDPDYSIYSYTTHTLYYLCDGFRHPIETVTTSTLINELLYKYSRPLLLTLDFDGNTISSTSITGTLSHTCVDIDPSISMESVVVGVAGSPSWNQFIVEGNMLPAMSLCSTNIIAVWGAGVPIEYFNFDIGSSSYDSGNDQTTVVVSSTILNGSSYYAGATAILIHPTSFINNNYLGLMTRDRREYYQDSSEKTRIPTFDNFIVCTDKDCNPDAKFCSWFDGVDGQSLTDYDNSWSITQQNPSDTWTIQNYSSDTRQNSLIFDTFRAYYPVSGYFFKGSTATRETNSSNIEITLDFYLDLNCFPTDDIYVFTEGELYAKRFGIIARANDSLTNYWYGALLMTAYIEIEDYVMYSYISVTLELYKYEDNVQTLVSSKLLCTYTWPFSYVGPGGSVTHSADTDTFNYGRLRLTTNGPLIKLDGTLRSWDATKPTGILTHYDATHISNTRVGIAGDCDTEFLDIEVLEYTNPPTVTGVCYVATLENDDLSTHFIPSTVIDGYILELGTIILIKDQDNAVENGVYAVNASGPPTRVSGFENGDSVAGAIYYISEGSQFGTYWVVDNIVGADIVGTDNITFSEIFYNE